MPGSPPTSPNFGAPRFADSDDATFSTQVNGVTDTFDSKAVQLSDPRLGDQRVPLDGSVTLAKIPNASLTGGKLAANTVTEANLAPASVGTPEIIDGSITTSKLAPGAITTALLTPGSVVTPTIADGAVTVGKLATPAQQALNAAGDLIFSAATSRVGAVLCDGKSYARTDPLYAALFAAIGTTYGAPDNNTFNVPNYLGRVLVVAGAGAGLTNRPLGSTFGEESHVLSAYEMPSHGHALSDPGHAHSISDPGHAHSIYDPGHAHTVNNLSGGSHALNIYNGSGPAWTAPGTGSIGSAGSGTGIGIYAAGTGIGIYSAATGISIGAAGSSGAHNNCQPSAAVNVFVKL